MRSDPRDLASDTDPRWMQVLGAIRRVAISLTTKALWQVVGFKSWDGSQETRQVEVFPGLGFYARPPSSGNPEAIVVMIGADASSPAIVATRDEKTRAAIAGAIAAGETMVFNASAVVYLKADSTIEARSSGGTATELPTKADAVALLNAIKNAAVVANDGGAAFKANIIAALANWPACTQKFKAE